MQLTCFRQAAFTKILRANGFGVASTAASSLSSAYAS
jgi:hypothetical protein